MGLHLHCIGVLPGWDGEPGRLDSLGRDAKRVHGFLIDVEVEDGDEDENEGCELVVEEGANWARYPVGYNTCDRLIIRGSRSGGDVVDDGNRVVDLFTCCMEGEWK